MRCPSCSTEVREKEASCPACGAALAPSSIVSIHGTVSAAPAVPPPNPETPRPPSSRSGPKTRFLPGELVSGRYRIVAVLGRGGMGEVYRADDLVLEQPVALKFLRAEIGADPAARERFLSEVKLSRAVTHPNVCRVHDVGELDGLLYLSMEYVDGEDLAALLRRIGAPSEKKALELATQLCAGLAAAHARGVLHRDLKPANVMIDGAGKVRITDFGLAILEQDERERGVVAGTPEYMAPEQLAGGEATAKSDIYALGLVLYELVTGVRVWKSNDLAQLRNMHARRTPDAPSTHARDLGERIERAIVSCLERDPARRPRSPTAVAVALTGADPIAAALAAGETPTPEMVAASGGEGTLSTTVAVAALVAILVLFAAVVFVAPRASMYGHTSLEDEPAVLAHRAREILVGLGLAVTGGDRAFGLTNLHVDPSIQREPIVQFWYREAPFLLQPSDRIARLSFDDPPLHWPGMVSLWLSTSGQLNWLEAVPLSDSDPTRSGAHCNWDPLFAAAGLSRADFKPVEPTRTPPQGCDEHLAWTGPDPHQSGSELTVEGAAFEGRPVLFGSMWPLRSKPPGLGASSSAYLVMFWLWLPAMVGGIVLARRNVTRGRGDRRAAGRLAFVVVLGQLICVLVRARHTLDLVGEQWLLIRCVSVALYDGGFVWVLYMALEPYVRRTWPDRLVSWSRLFAGRWRDPLVARDVMAGLGAAVLASLASFVQVWIGLRLDAPQAAPISHNFPNTDGLRQTIAQLCVQASDGLEASCIFLFSLVALRFCVRRNWIAYILFASLMTFVNPIANSTGLLALDLAFPLLLGAMCLFLVVHFGLVALAVVCVIFPFLNGIPLTSEMSTWYASQTIFAALVVGGLSLAAARFATGKRALFA